MNLNLYVIKLFLLREFYTKYNKYFSNILQNQELLRILKTMDGFYEHHPDQDIASIENLEVLFHSDYPALRTKELTLYTPIFERLRAVNPDPDLMVEYLEKVAKSEIATELAIKAVDVSEGRESPEVLAPLLERLTDDSTAIGGDLEFVSDDLDEILKNQVDKPGLNWRLECLNQALGPLRKGDFGFIFKRPETGGTTFLASEATFMAGQTDLPILWFNNEEQTEKVILRCYQSALGCGLDVLYSDRRRAMDKFSEITRKNLRFPNFDDSVMSFTAISRYLDETPCSLIIFDQIDKIKGFKEDRKDQEYGEIYKWARAIAKKHAPVIAVCQASASAEGKMWLTMDDVAESKTSKQAEADWLMGIGAVHEDGKKSLRYLSICKNKLVGGAQKDERLRHGHLTTLFKPEIARYLDPPK